MNQPLFILLFAVLAIATITWFALCHWMFRRLENRHQEKYIELGRPSLFLRNNIENNYLFLRFLIRSEYQSLEDKKLAKVVTFMKICLLLYTIFLVSFLFTGVAHLLGSARN